MSQPTARRAITRRCVAVVLGAAVALGATSGCAGTTRTEETHTSAPATSVPTPSPANSPDGARTLPPTAGAADYQLGGAYAPPAGVTVVARDSTEQPAPGIYSICYVNGFQTQPGVEWPASLLVHTADGELLVDPGWPDEHILDLSTGAQREAAADIQYAVIDGCAADGFQGVEFDNLDSYTRSDGAFGLEDAVAFATLLTAHAHLNGLAGGQKNTAELGSRGATEIGFDFAVTEECDRYAECDVFTAAYGDHVIDIEYTDDLRDTFAEACARPSTPPLTILRDSGLAAAGEAGYVYGRC
jgi:Glycoside-hydrolase family GH114